MSKALEESLVEAGWRIIERTYTLTKAHLRAERDGYRLLVMRLSSNHADIRVEVDRAIGGSMHAIHQDFIFRSSDGEAYLIERVHEAIDWGQQTLNGHAAQRGAA